jgi:hypothetical protein
MAKEVRLREGYTPAPDRPKTGIAKPDKGAGYMPPPQKPTPQAKPKT